MTKTKLKKENSTSKKIKELTGVKPERVSKEQLEKIQDLVNKLNRSQIQVGRIEVEKHELVHMIARVNDELTLMQGELEKEYGTFDINITDGLINYPKENGEVNKKD